MPPVAAALDDREQRVFGRVLGRLIPFIFLCYVVAYIDRVNIGFAAVEMQKDLGLSDAVYGLGRRASSSSATSCSRSPATSSSSGWARASGWPAS